MTLIPTPGAPDANSMTSLDEALAHLATLTEDQREGWPSVKDEQEALLIQAANRMNVMRFKGVRAASEDAQPMPFPRIGLKDRGGFDIAPNAIPRVVKQAQVELALWLGKKDRNADPAPARLKVGPMEIEGKVSKPFPDHVIALLMPFLEGASNCIKLVRR